MMEDVVSKLVDAINELDVEDGAILLSAIVAEFIESVTDEKYIALAEINSMVAELLSDDDEVVH